MGLAGEANLTRTSGTGLLKESEVRAASKQAEEVIRAQIYTRKVAGTGRAWDKMEN